MHFVNIFLVKDAKAKGTQSPMENDCGEFKQLSKGKKKETIVSIHCEHRIWSVAWE